MLLFNPPAEASRVQCLIYPKALLKPPAGCETCQHKGFSPRKGKELCEHVGKN